MYLKNNPFEEVKNEIKEELKQDYLHEKYEDIDENVKIIEKSNTFKFTVNTLKSVIKTVCNILILILASIGILAFIYPEPRKEILEILSYALPFLVK